MAELYVNEKFKAFVIRRDLDFWTGTSSQRVPYTARLYPSSVDASITIARRRLGNDATVREVTLHHH